MSASRPVRVTRVPKSSGPRAVRLAVPTSPREPAPAPPMAPTPGIGAARSERRENRGGTQRAVRLSLLYAVAIAVLYGALAAIARTAPSGGSSGVGSTLVLFGLLTIAIVAVGALVALTSAPRAIVLSDDATVVIGRFGRARRFPGLGELRWTVLRRFPAGFLSSATVESVELLGRTGRHTYLLEERLLGPLEGAQDAGPLRAD